MAFGFVSYSDSGTVQIDENNRNYSVIETGSRTVTGSQNTFVTTTVTVNAVAPLIAWSGNAWVCSSKSTRNGSTWALDLAVHLPSGTTSATFTYYVFDRPAVITGGNAGLQVFNAWGELCFDSSMRWARMSAIVGTDAAAGQVSHGLPGGRRYAVTQLVNPVSCNISVAPSGGGSSGLPPGAVVVQSYQRSTARADGDQVSTLSRPFASSSTSGSQWSSLPSSGWYNRYGSTLVLDVTNY